MPAKTASERCHTAQLTARLGTRTTLSSGQVVVPLVYINTSARPCLLHGVPGLDLRGPADPNGSAYSLRRVDKGGGRTLAPGASASARVVVLPYSDGSLGSEGSQRWTPTQLVTIPPGETTHPGSWVESF